MKEDTEESKKLTLFSQRSDEAGANVLEITLKNGVLTDSKNRTGYIAANQQFQFDAPAQTGAIYTGGFSACANGTLALGGSAVWYECLSGTFYNLYEVTQGAQCQEIFIDILPVSASASASAPVAGQSTDGQVTATTAVSQITDGQIQATSTSKVSQITDGQIQATTPASSLATTSSAAKVSQITDGQIQATSSAAKVSQITDGQIQATTATAPKATTSSIAKVSQITDGQIQATTAATVAPYTGAAAMPTAAAGLLVGAAAVAAYIL